MFLVYSLLFTLGVVLTAPYYLWRLRGKILSAADWRERLGFLPAHFPSAEQAGAGGALWVHAVSVGETLAVAGLVKGLQKEFPERKVFLSSVTVAGREVGEKRLPDVAGHFYLPLDWRASARRVMDRLHPALLLIVETELWPNLLRAAHERGTRVALVNARLSNRSFRGYRLAKPFMRRVLECVDWIGAQTAQDAERFVLLGAQPERVAVVGNLKFDGQPPQISPFTGRLREALESSGRRPVLVAASTMAGEEQILLQAWKEIRAQHPRALLILAPRHVNRFEEVSSLFLQSGRSFVRRTALEPDSRGMEQQLAAPEVLLLDTIGELAGIFELADAVFVGGSLVPTGGHNLLEPAYWGKPILFGPHMENFRDIAQQFTAAGAAVQVHSAHELARAVSDLLRDKDGRRAMGDRARHLMQQGAGATERTLEQLRIMLGVHASAHTRA
ncbi:MAG: 3-deoxy-D-manno-octulosonic acid transferase [Terriglobia bacterium]|jgi:3-deoxy-D-manno-octulosonic-acid transferase